MAGAGRSITGRSSTELSTFGWCSRNDGCGNRRKLCSEMLDVVVAAALGRPVLRKRAPGKTVLSKPAL